MRGARPGSDLPSREELPGFPPACDLEARLGLILGRTDEILTHPAWPELVDEGPALVEAGSNAGLEIGALLSEIDPWSQAATDRAALAANSESVYSVLALDETLDQLNVAVEGRARPY